MPASTGNYTGDFVCIFLVPAAPEKSRVAFCMHFSRAGSAGKEQGGILYAFFSCRQHWKRAQPGPGSGPGSGPSPGAQIQPGARFEQKMQNA